MLNLIIADDESFICQQMSQLLDWHELGVKVVGLFVDGGEAIDYIENNRVDIVISDIKMKKISGLDIAKYIYEQHLNTRVILISAYRDFEYAREAVEYKAEAYLVKPTTYEDMYNAVKKAINSIRNSRDFEPEEISAENVVDQAIEYIRHNFPRKVSLQEVSDEVHLTPAYFSRLFKRVMNTNFVNYITEMKIDAAKNLLKYSDEKVYRISEYLGYNTMQHFLRVFKKSVGCTPNEYRLKMERENEGI